MHMSVVQLGIGDNSSRFLTKYVLTMLEGQLLDVFLACITQQEPGSSLTPEVMRSGA